MEWNSTLYDKKHDFVAEYGKGLLEFVPKNKKQTILDLGCGTGTLTVQLGLTNWMKQFFSAELSVIPENIQVEIFKKVEELTKDTLWNGKEWVADYRRLRVVAHT